MSAPAAPVESTPQAIEAAGANWWPLKLARELDDAILNLRGAWHVSDNLMLFARVENVFDEDYATFGLLGDPGEVFAEFTNPRFLGAGPPRGAWVGARVKW